MLQPGPLSGTLLKLLYMHTTELTKIDKVNYLTFLLEGAAAHSIQGLTLSESNYDSAVELLKRSNDLVDPSR